MGGFLNAVATRSEGPCLRQLFANRIGALLFDMSESQRCIFSLRWYSFLSDLCSRQSLFPNCNTSHIYPTKNYFGFRSCISYPDSGFSKSQKAHSGKFLDITSNCSTNACTHYFAQFSTYYCPTLHLVTNELLTIDYATDVLLTRQFNCMSRSVLEYKSPDVSKEPFFLPRHIPSVK